MSGFLLDTNVISEFARPDNNPNQRLIDSATALEHKLTIVTRNTTDFISSGAPILNQWQI